MSKKRSSLLSKIAINLFVILTVFGVATSYFIFKNITTKGENLINTITDIGDYAVVQVASTLDDVGKKIIKQKAEDVARQLEIYIKENPQLTIEDLQEDEIFRSLAVQPIGETGYTATTDVDTLVNRFHASEEIENLDLHILSESLPGFWKIMSKTEGGIPAEGFYDWDDPLFDEVKQKYMYIAIVDARTADDVQLSVAATTYLDEFSSSIVKTQMDIGSSQLDIIDNIQDVVRQSEIQFVIFNAIVALSAVVIVLLVVWILVLKPLKKLTRVAVEVEKGDLDVRSNIKSNDEIGLLSESFNKMTNSLVGGQESTEKLNKTLKLLNKILRHDMLNDIIITQGNVDTYLEYGEPKDVKVLLKQISKQTSRSKNLINQMRDLEKGLYTGQSLTLINCKNIIKEVSKDFSDLEISINGVANILADSAFSSVITNLFRNSLIHGEASRVDIYFNESKDGYIEIRIADDGKGISDEVKKRLFREGAKFGETGNTGLGLYIVKSIIERYGGNITVEDNEPSGVVFVINVLKSK